jgi:branched-chain amino acid transport system substrate-binding protein
MNRESSVTRRTYIAATGAGLLASTAGCFGSGGDPNTLKIGAVYPLSGALAPATQRNRAMLTLSLEDYIPESHPDFAPMPLAEQEGFSNLEDVEVLWADNRGEPTAGRNEAERLISDENVDILMGSVYSSVTNTVQQVSEREGIPYINTASTAPDLTSPDRGLEWFWRTGPHEGIIQRSAMEYLTELADNGEIELNSAAILHENTDFGQETRDVQLELLEEYDIELAEDPISYTAEQVSSFNSTINVLRESDPDVFFHTGFVQDTLLLNRNMRDLNWAPPIMFGNGGYNQTDYYADNPDLSEYILARTNYSPAIESSEPAFGAVNDYMRQGVDAFDGFDGYSIRMWGGWMATLSIIDELGSTDSADIKDAMNEVDRPAVESSMPYGLKFDENGQNERTAPLIIQFEDGESNLLFPHDIADSELIYPAPGWEER